MSTQKNRNVLVLGASGMLGNAVLRVLAADPAFSVWGSVRTASAARSLPQALRDRVLTGVDVLNTDQLAEIIQQTQADVIVNCAGVVKQLAEAENPLVTLPLNSLLPHRLALLARLRNARLVHVSTDCVFSGTRGMYTEADAPDAGDLYGRSKLLGEVDYENAVTLRTSIIGHELASAHGLVGWFLSQPGRVRGFTRAIFSGLPTVELATVIRDVVIPHTELRGVYHVSASPINKYELLRLVAQAYERPNEIEPDASVVIDRSLDSSRFREQTGYQPPAWDELVRRMRNFG